MGDVLEAAADVAALADRRSAESEGARRLDGEVVAALAEADLFRLCVPAAYGGRELTPMAMVEVLATVGAGDGAAGWCAMIASTSSVMSCFLEPAAAQEVFGGHGVATGGTYAPLGLGARVDGGYRVTGRWSWGSGLDHCAWAMGGAMTDDGGFRLCFVRRADVILHDTWHTSGLRGTGSGDWSVDGVHVPDPLALDALPLRPVVDAPVGRFPTFGLLSAGVAAVALGLGRRAVDEIADLALGKVPQFASKSLATSALAQVDLARAEALVSSGRTFLLDELHRTWELAQAGEEVPVARRARLRLAAASAAASAAAAVDLAYDLGGGSSVFSANALQRCWRDVHTATQHLMVSRRLLETFGKARLGQDVDTTML